MLYFFGGVLIGAILNIFFLQPLGGIKIYPEWHAKIDDIERIKQSRNVSAKNPARFFIKKNDSAYIIKGDGSLLLKTEIADYLTAFSGNGRYYIKFKKVDTDIEFYNINGDRFWKKKARDYPYLSYNGKLIFLMNGDHSRIRILDYNGNEIGENQIVGRMCTVLSFSEQSDYGGLGFLDGSYYAVDKNGKIILSGTTPSGTMVKGMAISSNGAFAVIHYGDTEKDFIKIIHIQESEYKNIRLSNVHPVKTSIYINNNGYVTIIDIDNIFHISNNGKIEYNIKIPAKRYGFSAISYNKGLYSVSYSKTDGGSKLILFKENGTILLSKEFRAESFLQSVIKKNVIFLRGSDNLYCYSIHY